MAAPTDFQIDDADLSPSALKRKRLQEQMAALEDRERAGRDRRRTELGRVIEKLGLDEMANEFVVGSLAELAGAIKSKDRKRLNVLREKGAALLAELGRPSAEKEKAAEKTSVKEGSSFRPDLGASGDDAGDGTQPKTSFG